MRPFESTRILPRLELSDTPTVAEPPVVVIGVADAAVALPPPPQPATTSATSPIRTAPMSREWGLLRVM